jgi:hypothetical protein
MDGLLPVFCTHEVEWCYHFDLNCARRYCTQYAVSGAKLAGEYADNNFLNGQAAFQLSIEQSGNAIHVSFDAAYSDAHDAAPDGEGSAKITGKNLLQFNWEDSFNNSGTGTVTRTSDGINVSMKTTRVVDSRCLVFYGQNMRLKRVKK